MQNYTRFVIFIAKSIKNEEENIIVRPIPVIHLH